MTDELRAGDRVRMNSAIRGTVLAVMGQYVKVRGEDGYLYEVDARDVDITRVEDPAHLAKLG